MKLSNKAEEILKQISGNKTKLGDLRTLAKSMKKDHKLAAELWSTGDYFARQLAILIMDKKLLTAETVDQFINDIEQHKDSDQLQLIDWFMANQLTKNTNTLALLQSWEHSSSSLNRRVYWYYQARLRWTGKIPTDSEELLAKIETKIEKEKPEVQWAMNFTAAWIGVFEKNYRNRCIALGKKTGLYKGQKVLKGCTPDYLPEFIEIERTKRNL